MKIHTLELRNFGPYYGEEAIDFSVSEAAPVILVHGENMRGKTSLLRALHFVLFGRVKTQDGRSDMPNADLVNLDALAEGEVDFAVKLRFSHRDEEFELERSAIAVDDEYGVTRLIRPHATLLPIGGVPFPEGRIPDVVQGILDPEIADFSLFDGEMLARFEERLRAESGVRQGFVRSQVERALGVPFLQTFRSDLAGLESQLADSIRSAVNRSKRHEETIREIALLQSKTTRFKDDLLSLENVDERLSSEITELESKLGAVNEVKEFYYERAELERENERATLRIADIRKALADLMERAWWLPLHKILLDDLQATEERHSDALTLRDEDIVRRIRVEQIQKQLSDGICDACGQPVVVHDRLSLEHELTSLRAIDSSEVDIDDLRERLKKLRPYQNAAGVLDRVLEQEQDIRREGMYVEQRSQRIAVLSERLSGVSLNIASIESNLEEKKNLRRDARAKIADVRQELQRSQADLKQKNNKLAQLPEVDDLERDLHTAVQRALQVAEGSIDEFREAMRLQVRSRASSLFRQLTTEKEYSGIDISGDYQISVLAADGNPLTVISAGANQILTMAFVWALGLSSGEELPMVIDTPFGRLDRGHRKAILSFISQSSQQVALFLQSGEFDEAIDRALLGSSVGREYRIERVSPTRSRIVEVESA